MLTFLRCNRRTSTCDISFETEHRRLRLESQSNTKRKLSPGILPPYLEQGTVAVGGVWVLCEYSHIPMTVNQELLSNTKHAQKQKGAITLTLFGRPPRDIDKTTLQQPQKGWRLALMPPCASRHIGGSRQGHPRRDGRPWVAHNTIHSATNVHDQKDRHHCL